MKTKIYYFSGTGNSYYIARELQRKIENCEALPITDFLKKEPIIEESDRIGFVFPLYFMSIPKVVVDFVERISIKSKGYIFAVVTRGGNSYQGSALRDLNKLLLRRGNRLSMGAYIRMPENYIPLLKVPDEEFQNKLFLKAEERAHEISEWINRDRRKVEREFTAFLKPLVYKPFIKKMGKIDRGFEVTKDCSSCGLCAKICHFNNINVENGKPIWNNGCQFCLACIHYCPAGAIEYKKGTKGKKRYHHPEVPLKEYIKI